MQTKAKKTTEFIYKRDDSFYFFFCLIFCKQASHILISSILEYRSITYASRWACEGSQS